MGSIDGENRRKRPAIVRLTQMGLGAAVGAVSGGFTTAAVWLRVFGLSGCAGGAVAGAVQTGLEGAALGAFVGGVIGCYVGLMFGNVAWTVAQMSATNVGAREKLSAVPRSPNQDDPERWSAEWRAFIARQPKRDITLDDDRESIYAG